jgi:3-isopropylmalate/(R)-2-methylmalate dehydratase small subunit
LYLKKLIDSVTKNPTTSVVVDLEKQVIECNGAAEAFEINAYKKACLLNGYDDIDYLLSLQAEIRTFDQQHSLQTA